MTSYQKPIRYSILNEDNNFIYYIIKFDSLKSQEEFTIEIKEDYELQKYVRPTKIMLLTTTRPKIKGGKITLGNYEIQFNKKDMNASFENISDKLDRSLQNLWGKEMYRIVLTIKGKRTKGTITYKIVRR